MILRQLVLEDFGLYGGVQTIDLAPRKSGGRLRPVVLFGGKNGAGKSTIFEAILICLYGKGAFGDRVRQADYFEFLFRRIHRGPQGMESTRASVSVEFDFVQSGVRHLYEVRRSWSATSGTAASVDISVDLRRDGQRLDDLDHSHWDDFLRELIPPGLSQLFFFDGEKIQRLADEQDSTELGQSVKSLLNLDLVDRLSVDLQVYLGKQAKEVARDIEREEIERLEGIREGLRERLEHLQTERASLQATKIDFLSSRVESIERRLRAEGSELAKGRDSLFTEKAKLMAMVEAHEERLRELCSSTLPFALCPRLATKVKDALIAGANSLTGDVRKRVLSATSEVLQQFTSGELVGVETVDVRVRRKTAAAIEAELKKAIKRLGNVGTGSKILDEIAPSERSRMLAWIESAFVQTAPEAKTIGKSLEKHIRRLQKVEAALQQMPSDESLKATLTELTHAHEELGSAEQQVRAVDEEVSKNSRDLAEVQRRLDLLVVKVGAGKDAANRISIVKRSQEALREYLVAVTKLKLTQLELEVTKCFGELCRKGDLVRGVRIDAESFEIVLLSKSGETIPKEILSAGEKQIFAVALLWALARTSGRPLPVIIDTPLARLDSSHRKLFIERYLPSASHQVLVLSTDTEVDANLFSMLQPYISHAYHLQYDGENRCTTATPGYFWRSDASVEAAAS
jgi:DNA sulfur modification protein DndD